jgi:hypothetical protein
VQRLRRDDHLSSLHAIEAAEDLPPVRDRHDGAEAVNEPMSLAEALPAEINRVRKVQDTYKQLCAIPDVIVEPQILMMERAIQAGINASASGDVVAMINAYQELKEFEE